MYRTRFLGHGLRENLMSKEVAGMVQSRRVKGAGSAALSGLNRNTVNRLYRGVRERMLLACEAQRRLFGVVAVDESFFGQPRCHRSPNNPHLWSLKTPHLDN